MLRIWFLGLLVLALAFLSVGAAPARPETVESPAPTITVSVDAAKTGEPVSKYIYGQFIEHLGRCIYGGIWAEMLEDRKFYYPVPADGPIWKEHKGAGVLVASPWQVIGPKGCVKMVRENPYIGQHAPELQMPGDGMVCGIFQEGLGLVEGKEYAGRIVLAGNSIAAPIEVSLVWGQGSGDRQKVVIEKVGGVNPKFKGYGYEHCEYTLRCHRAGLTTGWQEFAHLVDAEEYIELAKVPPANSEEEREQGKAHNIEVLRETHRDKSLIHIPLEEPCPVSA